MNDSSWSDKAFAGLQSEFGETYDGRAVLATETGGFIDVVRRSLRDRVKPLRVAGAINSPVALPASWIASGALFGLASALVLRWSLPATIFAIAVVAALSWLARGIANILLACVAMLVLIAIVFQATHFLFPGSGWSLSWLEPFALAGVISLLFFGRRLKPQPNASRAGALIELIAAIASLLFALKFAADVSSAGDNGAALFLLTAEDNDAWINLVGTLRDAHGVTELTGSSIAGFGPVVATFLACVRTASSGIFPASLPFSSSPRVVLSAYGLLVAAAPIAVALLIRRMLHLRYLVVTLLVWACATALIVSACIELIVNGFLSATLALLLILAATYVVSTRPRFQGGKTYLYWLATTSLLFGAGAAWIGLAPLAGAAIAACCLPVLFFARRDSRRMILAALFCLSAVVMGLELLQQYRNVADPIGGGTTLLTLAGGTPAITTAMQALVLVLLFALVWLSSSKARPTGSAPERGFATPLAWLVGYITLVLVATAWLTNAAPGYGPLKMQFVLVAVGVPLAVIEIFSRLEIGRQQLNLAAIVGLAVLWSSTVKNGPIYDAATRHWPQATAKPVWLDTVQREVKLGGRVLCLSTEYPSKNSYLCNRFVSSAQGLDDSTAATWRGVSLGLQPISDSVSEVGNAKDKPWRIVVIGQTVTLHDPQAWWAPIVTLPGLKFVPASG